MTREYRYVGPAEIAREALADIERLQPRSLADIRDWPLVRGKTTVELTFIVDTSGALWLSDRRTEHVACARGGPVLAAGELTLGLTKSDVVVLAVTNQSTGYCPEPACWPDLRAALERAGLRPPPALTHAFELRRCEGCGTINVLKEEGCGSFGAADEPEPWPPCRRRARLGKPGGCMEAGERANRHCSRRAAPKEEWYECGNCGAELPRAWNLDHG